MNSANNPPPQPSKPDLLKQANDLLLSLPEEEQVKLAEYLASLVELEHAHESRK